MERGEPGEGAGRGGGAGPDRGRGPSRCTASSAPPAPGPIALPAVTRLEEGSGGRRDRCGEGSRRRRPGLRFGWRAARSEWCTAGSWNGWKLRHRGPGPFAAVSSPGGPGVLMAFDLLAMVGTCQVSAAVGWCLWVYLGVRERRLFTARVVFYPSGCSSTHRTKPSLFALLRAHMVPKAGCLDAAPAPCGDPCLRCVALQGRSSFQGCYLPEEL